VGGDNLVVFYCLGVSENWPLMGVDLTWEGAIVQFYNNYHLLCFN